MLVGTVSHASASTLNAAVFMRTHTVVFDLGIFAGAAAGVSFSILMTIFVLVAPFVDAQTITAPTCGAITSSNGSTYTGAQACYCCPKGPGP